MKKFIVMIFIASVLLLFLIFFAFFKYQDDKLHLVVCDVGQGDAIFIRTSIQTDILIDGGPDSSVLSCLSRHMPFWDRSLDLVIMTHPDADHSLGLIDVIDRYKIDNFYTQEVPGSTDVYKRLEAKLSDKKLSAKYLLSGKRISDKSGFSMLTLWPSLEAIERMDKNRSKTTLNKVAVVELVRFGDFKGLLTADIGFEEMNEIYTEANSINFLKVPHHGSRTGIDELELSFMNPDFAAISVGKNNYGHPSKQILDLLKKENVSYLRTDQVGDIEVISDGKIWFLKTKK